MLPIREQLREERRQALDKEGCIPHFYFTKSILGELLRWKYVLGSSTNGVRLYTLECGTEKRLQAFSNKY